MTTPNTGCCGKNECTDAFEEFDYEPLHLGNPAPEFTANTTHGEVSLSDYKGKWLILFSHPADFTPVCTTEFIAFAGIYEDLKKRNVSLLGLSVDSLYSHIAWVRNIKEKTGVEIPFPVIDDLSMDVAVKYNMIHPAQGHTSTVRTVFFIDPDGILRTMLYYPMTLGRNMDELVRIIDALQTSDKYLVATPANWRPGDKVIVPPARTTEKAEENFKNKNYEVTDWYLCKKSV
jgi:peroxiredoxin (alkyl hydroperoxide reductase subunit C)